MNIDDINATTPEGSLLLAALAVLTSSERIMILGEVYDGTQLTESWVLDRLQALLEVNRIDVQRKSEQN